MGSRRADNPGGGVLRLTGCAGTTHSCVLYAAWPAAPASALVLGALCRFGGSSCDGPIPLCGGSQPHRGPGPSAEQAGQACCHCVVRLWHGLS